MSCTVEIWQGALAPETYQLVLTSASCGGADLSDVSAAVLKVAPPRGASREWTVTRGYNAGTGELTLTHILDDTTTEVEIRGSWSIYAKLTTPDGTVRSRPRPLLVRGEFEVVPAP